MCGIAGIYEFASQVKVCLETINRMRESLAHRGPDSSNIYYDDVVGLCHTRLSILDLSEKASQPMKTQDGRFVITYNGEIYNYKDLRKELEGDGFSFYSNSDTEVVLKSYIRWGEDFLDKLSGIFSFAIWDSSEGKLFLARDPLGVKPLFYSTDEKTFRFGSEIKSILKDRRVSREFSAEGLDTYFTYGYSAAPMTGLKSVKQLLPGHCATVNKTGLQLRRYWQFPFREPKDMPLEEHLEEFESVFKKVVKRQIISDVPVGVLLSGGLDSSALSWALASQGVNDVKAFSAGFSESSFDETPVASSVAASLGLEFFSRVIEVNAVGLIEKISKFVEEPTADSSMLAVYLLSSMASEHVKVALGGDGADEILAGYETYRANDFARFYRMIPAFIRKSIISPMVRSIPVSDKRYSLHLKANRFIDGAEQGPIRDHCNWRSMMFQRHKRKLYSDDFLQRSEKFDPIARYAEIIENARIDRDRLGSYLHADTAFYLPNDMLVKVDRMSMAHGLEVRVPFLDVDFVSHCINLPSNLKLRDGKKRKYILNQMLSPHIDKKILKRPKAGFNIPLEKWMRQPEMVELFNSMLNTHQDQVKNYFNISEISLHLENHIKQRQNNAHLLFTLLMFFYWIKNIRDF